MELDGKLTFSIEIPYVHTEFQALKKLAIYYDSVENQKYQWVFHLRDIPQIVGILGRTIEFPDEEIRKLMSHSPITRKKVQQRARKKGKGYFEVIHRAPKIYIIETIINKEKVRKHVPTENIQMAWDVMKAYPIHKKVKTSTVAKNIVEGLGIGRFHRETGSFRFAHFFGSRDCYYKYFYAPIKVLQAEGVIVHHPVGMVERVADEWELQTQMTSE